MRKAAIQKFAWRLGFILLFSGVVGSEGLPQNQSSPREVALYSFKYLGLAVAHGSITVSDTLTDDGRPAKRIEGRASSVSPTSFLFKINNRYTTLIDGENGYPLLYEKVIDQSNLSRKTDIRFDREHRRVCDSSGREVTLSDSTHCFFSALYFMLNHRFRPREVLILSVYAAGQVWEVTTRALGTEKVITPVGAYQTVLIEIEFHRLGDLEDPIPDTDVLTHRLISEGKKTRLWISTGQERALVKGEYDLFPTGLQMILTDHFR